jgi:hypothetical protein
VKTVGLSAELGVRISTEEIEVNAVTTLAFGSSSASCSAALAPPCASVMPPAPGTMTETTTPV